jgi:hypothetical protein
VKLTGFVKGAGENSGVVPPFTETIDKTLGSYASLALYAPSG